MKLVGETFLGKMTYQHELKDGNFLWICPDREEVVVERVGKVWKIYFSVVNENGEKAGIEGKIALENKELIFFNVVFENDADYAEFYQAGNKEPSMKFIRDGEKLYLKDENDFYEVKRNDSQKVGMDSDISFLGKSDEYKYNKSTKEIWEYKKEIFDAFEIFFEQYKSNKN